MNPVKKNVTHTNTLYNEIIRYESYNTLLLKNYFDPNELFVNFKEEMDNEINKVGRKYR